MPIHQLKKIKAVLFDLDGTLVENGSIQKDATRQTLDFFGINITMNEFTQKYSNKEYIQVEKELIEDFRLNAKQGDITNKRKEIVLRLLSTRETKCTYFAKELLQYLYKKYPLAICSAGEREEVYLKLKNNNLLKYFKKIVSAGDVEKSKPHPDIYLKGAFDLGFKTEKCLAFEDTTMGVLAAKRAGTLCFAVPSKGEKDFSLADKVLDSLKDAYDILKSI